MKNLTLENYLEGITCPSSKVRTAAIGTYRDNLATRPKSTPSLEQIEEELNKYPDTQKRKQDFYECMLSCCSHNSSNWELQITMQVFEQQFKYSYCGGDLFCIILSIHKNIEFAAGKTILEDSILQHFNTDNLMVLPQPNILIRSLVENKTFSKFGPMLIAIIKANPQMNIECPFNSQLFTSTMTSCILERCSGEDALAIAKLISKLPNKNLNPHPAMQIYEWGEAFPELQSKFTSIAKTMVSDLCSSQEGIEKLLKALDFKQSYSEKKQLFIGWIISAVDKAELTSRDFAKALGVYMAKQTRLDLALIAKLNLIPEAWQNTCFYHLFKKALGDSNFALLEQYLNFYQDREPGIALLVDAQWCFELIAQIRVVENGRLKNICNLIIQNWVKAIHQDPEISLPSILVTTYCSRIPEWQQYFDTIALTQEESVELFEHIAQNHQPYGSYDTHNFEYLLYQYAKGRFPEVAKMAPIVPQPSLEYYQAQKAKTEELLTIFS